MERISRCSRKEDGVLSRVPLQAEARKSRKWEGREAIRKQSMMEVIMKSDAKSSS